MLNTHRRRHFPYALAIALMALLVLPSCFSKKSDEDAKATPSTEPAAAQEENKDPSQQPKDPQTDAPEAAGQKDAPKADTAPTDDGSPKPEADTKPEATPEPEDAPEANDAPEAADTAKPDEEPKADAAPSVQPRDSEPLPEPKDANEAIQMAQDLKNDNRFDDALRLLYLAELQFGHSDELLQAYDATLKAHPLLNAEPTKIKVGTDLSTMKRIGGGSSLVYKFQKDGENIAAFKPFQKRYQSNYRSEIAAYRLCPKMKCGFDIPVNLPVYFDYHEFSRLYSRSTLNPKEEFAEIIPTRLPDGTVRIDGTRKEWIKDFADFPIEFSNIWLPWLTNKATRNELQTPIDEIIPGIAKRHKQGEKYAKKLAEHIKGVSKYDLARQISNLIVFDYLINNWDRFSGSPTLYGVNCQIANGRFMSIDNGAGFSQTPHEKPKKWLHSITRFSKTTYLAIQNFNKEEMKEYLFPNATEFEQAKYENFWQLRQNYLDYVAECINQNGEAETFFFE